MEEFVYKIIPIILFFALGYGLKKFKLFVTEDASIFLKLVFYVCMPALSFYSLMETKLTSSLFLLPFIPFITMLVTYLLARTLLRINPLNKKTAGTFLLGSMIMNTGFTLPFFYAGYGSDGFTKAIIFDIGNSILIYTWAYFIAVKAGSHEEHNKLSMLNKCIFMPPLWALIIGIIIKRSDIILSAPVNDFFFMAGQPTIPLIMLSLGLYFDPSVIHLSKSFVVMLIRMLGGLLVGWGICLLLPFDPVTKIVIIASSGAPVGYNTLVFSTMEDLDKNFAATVVSISILIGIIYVPLLFFIFNLLLK